MGESAGICGGAGGLEAMVMASRSRKPIPQGLKPGSPRSFLVGAKAPTPKDHSWLMLRSHEKRTFRASIAFARPAMGVLSRRNFWGAA